MEGDDCRCRPRMVGEVDVSGGYIRLNGGNKFMVLKEKITVKKMIEEYSHYTDYMIKFCIDIKRRALAIDREMHIEMEHELYDDGSEYTDIFGGNLLIEDAEIIDVEWEAHPNIERNRQLGIGRGREITDQTVIDELKGILDEWIISD